VTNESPEAPTGRPWCSTASKEMSGLDGVSPCRGGRDLSRPARGGGFPAHASMRGWLPPGTRHSAKSSVQMRPALAAPTMMLYFFITAAILTRFAGMRLMFHWLCTVLLALLIYFSE